ncbi:unnamed protein product, partial [Mesorhabditis spiculigera]
MTAEASAHFAVELLKLNNNEKSFVFSPYSLATALAIVHAGAGGHTRQEMANVLLKGCNDEEVAKHYSGLFHVLGSANPADITIEVANKFFVDNKAELKKAYHDKVAKLYAASAENHNFEDGEGAAKIVNNYCEEKTHGKIKDVVSADMFRDAIAVLINAVYFKGMWASPFSKDATREDDFHGVNGVRKEHFMYRGELRVGLNFSDPNVQVCALPYKDGAYKMWFFLPKEGLPLKDWLNGLTGEKLIDLMKNATSDKCNVMLPRFKIESTMPAKENLEAIGLNEVFTNDANLCEICEIPLKVSDVIHKAMIEVNEEGAEAAAVTGLVMRKCLSASLRPPNQFFATRPFSYAISYGNDVLFYGVKH